MPTSELVKRVIKAADLKSKTVSVCGEGGDQTRSFVREAGAQLGPGVPRSSNYLVIVHGLKRGSEQHRAVCILENDMVADSGGRVIRCKLGARNGLFRDSRQALHAALR
eukprot:TRINITY_DN25335_c0_g1_i2.p1 TRINITY_DN25335_c0_g1~~TRINITY_DN25335_c0_g1_i2.p1  ORF type:complete len:109 (+),score=12.16 TRINITY_DN25335_c0_g1_i2:106-432(+)